MNERLLKNDWKRFNLKGEVKVQVEKIYDISKESDSIIDTNHINTYIKVFNKKGYLVQQEKYEVKEDSSFILYKKYFTFDSLNRIHQRRTTYSEDTITATFEYSGDASHFKVLEEIQCDNDDRYNETNKYSIFKDRSGNYSGLYDYQESVFSLMEYGEVKKGRYFYDDNNRLIQKETYHGEGSLVYMVIYKYELKEDNFPSKSIVISNIYSDPSVYQYEYKYDINGKSIKIVSSDILVDFTHTTTYKNIYDKKGNVIKRLTFSEDSLTKLKTIVYDYF